MVKLQHVPVMLDEAIDGLAVKADGRYFDGTVGRGGHACAVLSRLGPDGKLLLMDRDQEAIDWVRERFADDARVVIRHDNFAHLSRWNATSLGLDGVLLDLGMSSPQVDDPERGFSFMADAPLDMRMDTSTGASAADFLHAADSGEIADVLRDFGEERCSRAIARAIVMQRQRAPITRTRELATLIERVVGWRESGKHPATRSFQALRIRVNGELDALRTGLDAALERLKPGGRLVVIAFHSLEDRIVKWFIRDHAGYVQGSRRMPPVATVTAKLRAVGKARFPSTQEKDVNPRARSAVLRVAERLPARSSL